jgi:hypothetical protein
VPDPGRWPPRHFNIRPSQGATCAAATEIVSSPAIDILTSVHIYKGPLKAVGISKKLFFRIIN